jgi:hypothetical protein
VRSSGAGFWQRSLVTRLLLLAGTLAAVVACWPQPAQAYLGDGTYQWWFTKHGCTYTRTFQGGFQVHGRIDGNWQVVAQAVGGNKISWIRLEAWVVGWAESGLFGLPQWVKIGNKIDTSNQYLLSGKRTEPVAFNFYSNNLQVTNIGTMPDTVGVVYKISWRRQYGKWFAKKWITKKKTADFYKPERLSGNQVLSDVKHYIMLQQCKSRIVGSRGESAVESAASPGGVGGTSSVGLPVVTERLARSRQEPLDPFASLAELALLDVDSTPEPDRSFEGVAAAETPVGTPDSRAPPAPSLAVGTNRLLVGGGGTVNVLDKVTGDRIGSPTLARSLWDGTGGPCATQSDDASVAVIFDEHAGRFVAARAASAADSTSPARACLAVSATGDPSGPWNTYDAPLGEGLAAADVRLGGWPGSYVVTATTSPIATPPDDPDEEAPPAEPVTASARVVAFRRSTALAGGVTPSIVRQLPASDGVFGVAPVDNDADGVDPAAPILLVGTGPIELLLYRLSIDWGDPAAAEVSTAVAVEGAAAPISDFCQTPCAEQPAPGEALDVSPGRVGARPVVHRDGTGALRLAVAVSADEPFWVDITDPWGSPAVATSEGFSPDEAAGRRWFQPAIVPDGHGGYLVAVHGSGPADAPGPYYEAFDDVSRGGLVHASVPGAAPSTPGAGFGPDTAASRDPSDDCRIWVAGQHQRTGVDGDWSVRVTALRTPLCAPEANASPSAAFAATPSRARPPVDVDFDAAASSDPEDGALSYSWNFGDGQTGAGVTVVHHYANPGLFRVRLVVTDPDGGSATMTRLVEVVDDDEPPVAGPDDIRTKVGVSVTSNVIAGESGGPPSDWDPDGGPVTLTGNTTPTHGSVNCAPSGTCIYTPDAGYSGGDRFHYTLEDDEQNTVQGIVSVEVANRSPQLEEDGIDAGSGTPALENVFGNDRELDPGDNLLLTSNTQPAHGTASCTDDGECVYQSAPGFAGEDRFEYTATDGEASETTAVNVFVAECPDLTTAIGNGSSLVTGFEWIECAAPAAHGETTLSPAGLPRTGPAGLLTSGSAELAAPPNTEPDAGASLSTSARGAHDVSILKLDLQVPTGATCLGFDAVFASDEYPEYVGSPFNDAFLAELDSSTWTVDGQTISAPDNFAVDSAGRLLSVNSVLFSSVVTRNGTEYDGSTPPIRIQTPVTPGAHSLYFSIFDASDHILDSAAFIDNLVAGVTPAGGCVGGANITPTARPDTAATLEDSPVDVDVLANDSDTDGTLVGSSLRITTPPTSGTAEVVNGEIRYTPALNASGVFPLTYEICDNGGACASATLTVTVIAVNDPPIAHDDSRTTPRNTPLSAAVPAPTDPDSSSFTYSLVSGTPGLVFNPDGTYVYTPPTDFTGQVSFTYDVGDGINNSTVATVTITVTGEDGAPVVDAGPDATVDEGDFFVQNGSFTDPDADTWTATVDYGDDTGTLPLELNPDKTFSIGHEYADNGVYTITVSVSDGTTIATDTVVVTVLNVEPTVGFDEGEEGGTGAPGEIFTASGFYNDPSPVDTHTGTVDYGEGGGPEPLELVDDDRSFTLEHVYEDPGIYTITVVVTDDDGGVGTGTMVVTIAVQCDPVTAALSNGDIATQDGALRVTVDALGAFGSAVQWGGPAEFNPPGPIGSASTTFTSNLYASAPDRLLNHDCADGPTDVISQTATSFVTRQTIGGLELNVAQNLAPIQDSSSSTLTQTFTIRNVSPDPIPALALVRHIDGDLLFDGTLVDGGGASADGSSLFEFDSSDDPANPSTFVGITGALGGDPSPDRWTIQPYNYQGVLVANDGIPDTDDGVVHNDTDDDRIVDTPFDVTLSQQWNAALAPGASVVFTTATRFGQRPPNVNPDAVDDTGTTPENTPLDIDVLGNDTDADGDTVSVLDFTQPANGTVTQNPDGSLHYVPNAGFDGVDTFTYRVSDGRGGTDVATVTVTVTPANVAPVAVNDSASTPEDTAVDVDVLANDTDADGDTLTIDSFTQPAHGTVALVAGKLRYSPAANFHGPDSFTYRASDGALLSGSATVSVTVTPVNDAPVASDSSEATAEDTPLSSSASATDVDGDTLTFTLVGPGPAGLVFNANGTYTYTPPANFHGQVSFQFEANDGTADSNTATVTITVTPVNDAPVAANDSKSTAEDTPLSASVPAATDVEGDALTYHTTGTALPGLSFNADGSYTYTPPANFHGQVSFTYRANDGQANSNEATVTITVTPVNDAPVANDTSETTLEDTPLSSSVSATDVDGDTLTFVLVGSAPAGLAFNADGTYTYTPPANLFGIVVFQFRADDGRLNSNNATVTITITAVNDAPVAANDSQTTPEDTPLSASVPAATDVEGDTLTYHTTGAALTGLVFNANGTYTYTPPANFHGQVSFTYRANDGQTDSNEATVTITVTPVNDAPVASDGSETTAEDTPLSDSVSATDVDGDTLTFALVGAAPAGLVFNASGTYTYTPPANFHGTVSFQFTANDGTLDSNAATVTVTVTPVNDAPVAANDTQTTAEDTQLNASVPAATDADGDSLTYHTTGTPPAGLAFNANGTYTYTPPSDSNGQVSFTYRANDGTVNSNEATVTITVTPVNDAPIATNDSASTPEATAVDVDVLANDSDVDGDTLTVGAFSQGTNGTVALVSGKLRYTPSSGFTGADSFTYRANDGTTDSNQATVSITVDDANAAPVAVDDTAATNEDSDVDVDVLANDTDADGNTLSVHSFTQPGHGSVTLVSGKLRYSPAADFHGPDTFTYRATDGSEHSNAATVTVTVAPVNDPPNASDSSESTAEDTPLSSSVSATDVDGDTLTFALVGAAPTGLVFNANGSFTYTPPANFHGPVSFQFKANDGTVDSNTATVAITVTPVNDAPTAANDSKSTPEDTQLSASVPAASDVDGDALTYATTGAAPAGLVFNANGTYTYTPPANFNGPVSFTYRANDGTADSNTATVTITVTPVNDVPVAANDAAGTDQNASVDVDVLANDTDIDGPALSIGPFSQGGAGSVALVAGRLRYTPNGGFAGTDTFTYRATDGALQSNLATVTITVRSAGLDPNAPCTITGTGGNNTLTGTAGDDVICGLGGNDRIVGLGGDDVLKGGSGADSIDGDGGDDLVLGESNNDTALDGGPGNDQILGGAGHDKLIGDTGDDQLEGAAGRDWLLPGPGADLVSGDADADKIDFKDSPAAVDIDLLDGTSTGEGSDTVSGVEIVIGSPFGDRIDGSAGPDELNGYNGNDTINGRGGDDFIDGGRNTDACDQGPGGGTVINCEGRSVAAAATTSSASSTFGASNQVALQTSPLTPGSPSFSATFTWEAPGTAFTVTAELVRPGGARLAFAGLDAKPRRKALKLRVSVRRGATYMLVTGSVPKKLRTRGARIRFKLKAVQLTERTTVATTVKQRRR